jgi:tetratricopeptide (TPR) repeat protein
LEPRDARTHYNLGLLHQQEGELDESERELKRALELQPHSPDFLYALADHYLRRAMYDEVPALADRLEKVLPDQPYAEQLRQRAARQASH